MSGRTVITGFDGEYRFLSNFWTSPIVWGGRVAPSAEHHYAAAKAVTEEDRERIYACESPARAKRLGLSITLRPRWDEEIKLPAMESILTAKFSDPILRDRLLATGDALLIESNHWHDDTYGDCGCFRHAPWPGKNLLGILLMRERARLQDSNQPPRFPRVAVTGHRPRDFTPAERQWITDTLPSIARRLRDEYATTVAISGLALGVDTWWADAALDAGLDLWGYVPFADQPAEWHARDEQKYHDLLTSASRTVTLGTRYDVRLFHARNDLMIRDASLVMAIFHPGKTTGGTVSTVKKARATRKPLLLVNVGERSVAWDHGS